MKTVTEFLRISLLEKAGLLYPYGQNRHLTIEKIRASFAAPDFHRLVNTDPVTYDPAPEFHELADCKFIVGAFRYGLITEQSKNGNRYDHIGSIRSRLHYYQESGDMDVLPDIFNLAKAEWIVPHHEYANTDRGIRSIRSALPHVDTVFILLKEYDESGDLHLMVEIAKVIKAEWVGPNHEKAHRRHDDSGYFSVGRM